MAFDLKQIFLQINMCIKLLLNKFITKSNILIFPKF